MTPSTLTGPKPALPRPAAGAVLRFVQRNAVAIVIVLLMIALSSLSPSFLTARNLLNILNQNAPLAIMAAAMTMVVICGGFDLSVGAMFAVCGVSAAWVAVNVDPVLGLLAAPVVGLALGLFNGLVVSYLSIHSFLATLATAMVFRGIAILVTGGTLIPVRDAAFTWLGRGTIGSVHIAILVLVVAVGLLMVLLNGTVFGRHVYAVGGNEEASILSGIRTRRIRTLTFVLSGLAAGLAAAIAVSRVSMGNAGIAVGMELEVIAAVIIGGTSIYGGKGAIWRSVAGVYMLALINNGFNILNIDPFFKEVTTGLVILAAVAISATARQK
ncbi:ABC transporter permease [Pararhodobacter aggregans]|uniref:Autoinducer 2 import system permease protein LsrD n=1 Tax=Pararhodobacter aggregans TaxID=404875 RepID=A0A2T7UKW5_9RHOB|nr:ABC transporter permease [Pararhodobacter aggregans]PTX02361.1 monosaccharide ABC transporter membrane protein (CUT2 family) [Pararhodobacter aggregans]PVE45307.1 ABC transporter permease [Pararhodobacter aggregans]